MSQYYAVIEAGGTKFNCAIVNAERQIFAETRISTATPEETISASIAFFKAQMAAGLSFKQLGLATFGPVDLKPDSDTYGYITATPKPYWSQTPILTALESALNCQVSIDTDVNGAALAEYRWGAAQHTNVSVYVTIGTGVGGGVIVNGTPVHGLIHPEIGHMLIGEVNGVQGVCPFHGNCVEGLASGTAMGKIWQQPADSLPNNHQAWDIQAQVLARMCHNLLLNFSPEKIVLGGGVMNKPGLLEHVVKYTEKSLARYLTLPDKVAFSHLICLPGLGERSGLFGALALIDP